MGKFQERLVLPEIASESMTRLWLIIENDSPKINGLTAVKSHHHLCDVAKQLRCIIESGKIADELLVLL